jgi:deazaflavin-dependent oxidoreductase (nitroreductase family)
MTQNKSFAPWSEKQERMGKFIIKKIGKWQTAVYEATGGRLWNKFLGAQVAILTTIGRKSGEIRKTPLLYLEQDDDVIMVASQGGFSTEPFWYKNTQANPEVQVQIGRNKRSMIARKATDEEARQLWPQLDAIYAGYAEYRARTRNVRTIPIIIFSPKV